MTAADRAELEGVSAERAPQIVAGALIAEASMKALAIETVDICPWALREGLILRKLDSEADGSDFVGGAGKTKSVDGTGNGTTVGGTANGTSGGQNPASVATSVRHAGR